MTDDPEIDYEALTQDAMRGVMRAVLQRVATSGLPGDHHFYVAFNTRAAGVGLSRRLREKYPEEMTIVLQHRFWDLSVREDKFEVKLTFDGIPELLSIPFSAVKVFFDPSVQYGLQFEDSNPIGDPGRRSMAARRIDNADGEEGTEPSRLPGRAPPVDRRRSPRKPRVDRSADATAEPANQPGSPTGVDASTISRVPAASASPSAVPIMSRTEKGKAPAPAKSGEAAAPSGSGEEAAASDHDGEPVPKPETPGAKIVNIENFRKK